MTSPASRRRNLALIAALALFAAALLARLLLHPNTPYKNFLFSAAPMVALWLVTGVAMGAHPAARRLRLMLALTAGVSLVLTTLWCLMPRPDLLTPLPLGQTVPGLIGVWLVALFAAALLSGALNRYFRHGPMSALGAAAMAYGLASGFVPLPFGPPVMTFGMLWLAIWQGVYLYRAPASKAPA